MLTLFIMATGSSWADIMYTFASSTDIDYVHKYMCNPFWIFFSIFFIVVASFFLLNLFVGVVISNFNSEQDKLGGNHLLSEKQKEWIDVRLLVLRSAPITKREAPENRLRWFFFII